MPLAVRLDFPRGARAGPVQEAAQGKFMVDIHGRSATPNGLS